MLGGKLSQLVRIRLPRDSQVIPEISANKYALNVRFATFGIEPRPPRLRLGRRVRADLLQPLRQARRWAHVS